MLAGKFLSCGGLFGSIMAGSGEEERLPRTRHYISTLLACEVNNSKRYFLEKIINDLHPDLNFRTF